MSQDKEDTSQNDVPMADSEEQDLKRVSITVPPACSYEDVVSMLGNFGKFQLIQLSLLAVCFQLTAIMTLGFVFIGYTPPHTCNAVNETDVLARYGLHNDTTASVSYGPCHVTVSTNQSGVPRDVASFSCPNGRQFKGGQHLTLVSQWDLVCESMGMAELGQTLFVAGHLLGGFFVTPVADRFGRKSIIAVTIMICTLVEFCITFSPNIYIFWTLLFFDGIGFAGFSTNFFVLGLEYLGPKQRDNYGFAILIFWVFSVLCIDLMGYLFQDLGWRYFQAVGALSGLILFVYPCLLSESPRWLASKNRSEEALAILKKACRQNRIAFGPVKEKFMEYVHALHHNSQPLLRDNGKHKQSRDPVISKKFSLADYPIVELFRHKYSLVTVCICVFVWVTHNVTYYGIFMTSSSLSGDRFINFAALTLVELPSDVLILYLFKRVGRLVVLRMFLLMSAVSLLASSLVSNFFGAGTITTVLFIAGKFAISVSINALYIYTPEIFPTVIRSSAFGACKSLARIGSLMAPYFRPLYDIRPWAPGAIFSAMCVVSMFLVSFLPETKDRILSTNMEEMKQHLRERKVKNKPRPKKTDSPIVTVRI